MSLKKNKKSLYILIPLVIALWGYIIFQVVSGMNPSLEVIRSKPLAQKIKTKQDTLLLSLDYKDPFQVRSSFYSKPKANTKKKKVKKEKPIKQQTIWPTIVYQGRMANVSSGKITAILVVNGAHHMIKEKEKLNGLKVVHCWKDSVKLKYDGESKVFLK